MSRNVIFESETLRVINMFFKLEASSYCECQSSAYYGDFCELDANPCASSPCQNDATCLQEGLSFKCLCSLGYRGDLCDEVDLCTNGQLQCFNGGTCKQVNKLNAFCLCPNGFKGLQCEEKVEFCVINSNRCSPGSRCVDTINNYRCECDDWHFGRLCDETSIGLRPLSYVALNNSLHSTINDITITFATKGSLRSLPSKSVASINQ